MKTVSVRSHLRKTKRGIKPVRQHQRIFDVKPLVNVYLERQRPLIDIKLPIPLFGRSSPDSVTIEGMNPKTLDDYQTQNFGRFEDYIKTKYKLKER